MFNIGKNNFKTIQNIREIQIVDGGVRRKIDVNQMKIKERIVVMMLTLVLSVDPHDFNILVYLCIHFQKKQLQKKKKREVEICT